MMEEQPQGRTADRLVALDGLRGIAAIVVLMLHFDDLSGVSGVFAHGYLAVDFFYMLSGFVLVRLMERSPAAHHPLRVMAARIARLWPLMAVGLLIGLVTHALVWGMGPVLPLLALALFYVPRLSGNTMTFPLNQPQWSLQVELVANALHLLVLRRMSSRALLLLSALFWVVLLPATLREGSLQFGSQGDDWLFGFARAGFAYPVGIVLGRACLHRARAPVRWWLPPAVLLTILIAPSIPGLPDSLMDSLALLLLPLVLVAGARAQVPAEIAPRLTWLGSISFPLYATHFPILEAAHVLGDSLSPALRGPLFLGALALTVTLAHLLAKSPLAHGFRLRPARAGELQPAA